MSYLVQSPFGVSEEGDAVSLSDADCHGSESGSWGVPHCFSFQRCPAGHWAGGVVRATGIRLEGILWYMNTTDRLVRWFVLTWNTTFYCCHVEVFIDSLYLSQAGVPRHLPNPKLSGGQWAKSKHPLYCTEWSRCQTGLYGIPKRQMRNLFFFVISCVYHLILRNILPGSF